jgi:hypothetical protein
MFTHETTYTYALVAALTVAVVTTLAALAKALHSLQIFYN